MQDFPQIIQGGMGAGVSSWELARAVSKEGQLGVVSGTALCSVLIRRLQDGDPTGDMRRAMAEFPLQHWSEEILGTFFIEGGKPADKPFKLLPPPNVDMEEPLMRLMVVVNFVEVWLAKEGHDGVVGINYLEKIQTPTLPCVYGAMLAEVDYILMGAGIPIELPGILDKFSKGERATLRIHVEDNPDNIPVQSVFTPSEDYQENPPMLKRPKFLAIVTSHLVARTMERKATGNVEGYIVELHVAGGHNAPPRQKDEDGNPFFGPKDDPKWAEFLKLDKPFYIAGGYAGPDRIKEALEMGAVGIQVGTIFAFCKESGFLDSVREDVIKQYHDGVLEPRTDFRASPTGFPFKLIPLSHQKPTPEPPPRICDLGYLRAAYIKDNGKVGYRCPSEPIKPYLAKGGTIEETEGRQCLCNGLVANIGHPQVKKGVERPMLVTAGQEFGFLPSITTKENWNYSAADALKFLTGK